MELPSESNHSALWRSPIVVLIIKLPVTSVWQKYRTNNPWRILPSLFFSRSIVYKMAMKLDHVYKVCTMSQERKKVVLLYFGLSISEIYIYLYTSMFLFGVWSLSTALYTIKRDFGDALGNGDGLYLMSSDKRSGIKRQTEATARVISIVPRLPTLANPIQSAPTPKYKKKGMAFLYMWVRVYSNVAETSIENRLDIKTERADAERKLNTTHALASNLNQ